MLKLTKEQQDCVAGAIAGQDLKTKAFAGSGKTSTLVAIAKALPDKRILYLAYNKAIQLDAEKKFPDNVDCKTAHSLAFCRFVAVIGKRLTNNAQRLNIANTIKYCGITQKYDCSAEEIARKALRLLRIFVQSSYSEDYFKRSPKRNCITKDEQQEEDIKQYTYEVAYDYWTRCTQIGSELPINHDIYLKLYQLSKPNLAMLYDVILFDECQDANPVLLDIVINQKCQKIYVGDEHQQIYAWRGAINAFSGLDGEEYYLSQSFRFGNDVAKLANMILAIKEEKKELKGFSKLDTKIVDNISFPYTSLCRTNGKAIEVILDNLNKDIHLVGNNIKYVVSFLEDGCLLYKGQLKNVKHDLLKGYKSWEALIADYEDSEDKEPNLTLLMNFVERYSDNLFHTLTKFKNASYVKEASADLVISTVHKAKGREWDNVVIENDFKLSEKTGDEDWNLLYVAITRAQKTLCLKGSLAVDINSIFRNLDNGE